MITKILLIILAIYFLIVWPIGYIYTELYIPFKKRFLK